MNVYIYICIRISTQVYIRGACVSVHLYVGAEPTGISHVCMYIYIYIYIYTCIHVYVALPVGDSLATVCLPSVQGLAPLVIALYPHDRNSQIHLQMRQALVVN